MIHPKSIINIAVGLLSILFSSCDSADPTLENKFSQQAKGREKIDFGSDWKFRRTTDTLGSLTKWVKVNIPHTARIEPLIVNDQWQGKAVYLKNFKVEDLNDRKWFFYFEGVMQMAKVFINDSLVEIHKGGYLPFTVDATPYLKVNSVNRIKVKVSNIDNPKIPPGKPLESLDFNLFGGIYRNVYLIRTNPVYITDAVEAEVVNGGGILIHFDSISSRRATGFVKTHIKNETATEKVVRLRFSFSNETGRMHSFSSTEKAILPGDAISISENIIIDEPLLWSPSDPNLYNVNVEIIFDGKPVDAMDLRTGIRDIRLTGQALYLNGEEIFLNGTNRHQEYPFIGYALSDEAQYRDAYKIKEAGFNFVRLSHYPHPEAFVDAADELGLILMNSIPGWQYFGGEEFIDNSIQNIKDMVRRDRNHPSIVFWENSLNESAMTEAYIKRANRVLQEELPYDNTYSAGWIDHPAYDLFIPARQHAKPPHYWKSYDKLNRPILIAEYGDWGYYAQNAGFNQEAFSDLKERKRSSRQLRTAGEKGLLQQALNFQESFNSNRQGEQTIGQANWLIFDYNRGYSDDIEASGISDIFRLPKFAYYFYQSQKSPDKGKFSEPMVFIANYWTPTSTKKIKIFSNTEEVALLLNGKLMERKVPDTNEISDHLKFPPYVFHLDDYVPGKLKAVGYMDGKAVANHVVRTPEEPIAIDLSIDFSGKPIAEDHPDVVFVYASVVDENGTLVPTSDHPIHFSIVNTAENVRLIGKNPVLAKAGIASVLLRTENFSGPLTIRAYSEELGETFYTIKR